MYQLKFRPKAYKSMQSLVQTYPKEIVAMDSAFTELQEFGISSSQVKNIGRVKGVSIYRKRV